MPYLIKPFFQIWAFIALSALMIPASYADFLKGIEHRFSGENDQALIQLSSAANSGHIGAQVELGDLLIELGQKEKGISFLVKAKNQNSPVAAYLLTKTVDFGSEEYFKLLTQAAEGGVIDAQLLLMHHYLRGKAVKQNVDKAMMWARLALDANDYIADLDYAELTGDYNDVVHNSAGYHLAIVTAITYGHGSFSNDELTKYNEGYEFYKRYKRQKDENKAMEFLKKSEKTGYSQAREELGKLNYQGNKTPKDLNKAFSWFKLAAEQGRGYSQYWLAEMYRNGEGTKKNLEQAYYWYEKSANNVNFDESFSPRPMRIAIAKVKLAEIYYYGLGVPKDADKAKELVYEAYLNSEFWFSRVEAAKIMEELSLWP